MRSAGFAPSALLLTIPLAAGLAQEPRRLTQPDSVPFDLASALIAAGGLGGEPQILVGSLPGWVSARIKTPANATVLGSAFLGSTVVGIISLPDAPDAVIADMNRELAKQGWKAPPPQPSYGGGFRPAGFSLTVNGMPTRVTLCGDQQLLTVIGDPPSRGGDRRDAPPLAESHGQLDLQPGAASTRLHSISAPDALQPVDVDRDDDVVVCNAVRRPRNEYDHDYGLERRRACSITMANSSRILVGARPRRAPASSAVRGPERTPPALRRSSISPS